MQGLTIRRTISAAFSADRWELFDKPGRDEAAAKLNAALETAVNAPASDASSVYTAMDLVQNELSDFGAGDSEPTGLIDQVVEKVFHAG